VKKEINNFLLAILSGVLTALCLEPFSFSFLCFVAYVPLFFVFQRTERSFWKILLYSWLSLFVATIIGCQWVYFVSVEFGLLPWWIAGIVLVLFSLLTTFSLQIFGVLYHLTGRFTGWKKGTLFYFILIPSLFVISELLDPRIFNWYIGIMLGTYKYMPQFADVFGICGLGFLILVVNVSFFLIIKYLIENRSFDYKKLLPNFAIIIFILLFLQTYGYYRYQQVQSIEDKCPKIKVGVVQANIGNPQKLYVSQILQYKKEMGIKEESSDEVLILKKYEEMTTNAAKNNNGIDVVIWPETAFPNYYNEEDRKGTTEHKALVKKMGIPFIIGTYSNNKKRYYNSAVIVEPNGQTDYYHKFFLLPFGEFMPLGDTFPILKTLVPTVSDFSRGSGPGILSTDIRGLNIRFAPTICYEILKSNYSRKMVQKGANIFVNLANDSWFGSVEPYQHLRAARMRSIEFRRPIIRSTNTGVSGLINMNGVAVKTGGLKTEETLVFDVPVCDGGANTIYSAFGYLFPYFVGILSIVLVFYLRKKNSLK
jgi:apolipoprotein N-acyltransferase